MNLRDQLKEILPEILPENPAESIKGTELIRLVKHLLQSNYSDATLRYHFSIMSCDPSSPIAKVDQGQGYYLRSPISNLEGARNLIRMSQGLFGQEEDPAEVDAALHRANKFRALYSRSLESDGRFPYIFEGFSAEGITRKSIWRFPDAAVIDWDIIDDGDGRLLLDTTTLGLKQQLGSQPFTSTSVTMKLEADHQRIREDFFQCLSNSSWAHRGELVYATRITDQGLADDLRTLGDRFGIAVTSFGLRLSWLDECKKPLEIQGMGEKEFEALCLGISIHRITSGRSRNALNWNDVVALKGDSTDFASMLEWIKSTLDSGQAQTYRRFRDPNSAGQSLAS